MLPKIALLTICCLCVVYATMHSVSEAKRAGDHLKASTRQHFALMHTCRGKPNPGTCLAAFRRFFYNETSKNCEIFLYGGCGVYPNHFKNYKECARYCLH